MSYCKPYNTLVAGDGITLIDTLTTSQGSIRTTIASVIGDQSFGYFISNSTQTNSAANVVNLVTYSSQPVPSGMIFTPGGSLITVPHAGIYEVSFMLTYCKTDGGEDTASTWLRVDGLNVPNTRQDTTLEHSDDSVSISGMCVLQLAAAADVQIAWSSADAAMRLSPRPSATTPTRPAWPSARISIIRIA